PARAWRRHGGIAGRPGGEPETRGKYAGSALARRVRKGGRGPKPISSPRTAPSAPRAPPRNEPRAGAQPPDPPSGHRVGAPLRHLPRPPASPGPRPARDRGVPLPPGQRTARRPVDTEPGPRGAALPLRARAVRPAREATLLHARQAPASRAPRADAGGGRGG